MTFLGPLYFHIDFIINWPNNKNFCWSFAIALNVISLMVISVSTLYHLGFPDACTHQLGQTSVVFQSGTHTLSSLLSSQSYSKHFLLGLWDSVLICVGTPQLSATGNFHAYPGSCCSLSSIPFGTLFHYFHP